MKKYFLLLCCLAGISAYAQTDGTKPLTTFKPDPGKWVEVEGYMEGAPDDTLVQMYDPYNGDFDTTRIKGQRFKFKMRTPHGGTLCILTLGNTPEGINQGLVTYVEEGKLQIRGKGRDFCNAKLSGSAWVKEWNEIWTMLNPSHGPWKDFADMEQKYYAAVNIGDEELSEKYDKLGQAMKLKRDKMMVDWVDSHRNSGICAYLSFYFPLMKDKDAIFDKMTDHAKDTRIYKRIKFPNTVDPVAGTVKLEELDSARAVAKGMVYKGMQAPDFSLPDADGNMVSLADFKGKYLFLDFWASWCGPCVPFIPYLKTVNEKFKGERFEMLAVSLDDKKIAWLNAVKKHEINYRNASSLKGWSEPVALAYGVTAIPFNVLIGPDGKILEIGIMAEKMEEVISAHLK